MYLRIYAFVDSEPRTGKPVLVGHRYSPLSRSAIDSSCMTVTELRTLKEKALSLYRTERVRKMIESNKLQRGTVIEMGLQVNKNVSIRSWNNVKETNMGYAIRIAKCGVNDVSEGVATELAKLSFVSNMSRYIRLALTLANADDGPGYYDVLGKFSKDEAVILADLLAKDGIAASVKDENGAFVYNNAPISDGTVKPAVVAEVKKPVADAAHFEWEPQLLGIVKHVEAMYKGGFIAPMSLIVDGPSGWGKTTAASALAKSLGWDVVTVDVSLFADPEELYGYREIAGGSTTFGFSVFAQAIQRGNTVVVIDEINRAFPNVLNSMLAVLDDRRCANVRGHEIKVAPNTVFLATRNLGSQFTGTMQSDKALLNRFNFCVSVGMMAPAQEARLYVKKFGVDEKVAKQLVGFFGKVRDNLPEVQPSPRNAGSILQAVQYGMEIRNAVQYNLVNSVDDIDLRRQIEDIANSFFGKTFAI